MSLSKKHYEACLSVDLRCFDNTLPDFGVAGFFEKLGFIPSRIFNHETYMDQIHTHNGVIDDTPLEPQWISQRAVDSAQPWTRRQFKGLIDELHRWDVLFYQGCEAAWSVWPEYGEKSRCTYLYEHLPDIFIVNRDGRTTAQGGMGGINPLRRFRDGTLYEDWMIRDICRFLVDYECDGFFAADGFAGLVIPLENGCYGEDMIAQFTEYTGIEVPPGTTPQRADYIWTHLRGPWAAFYADRWAAFHKKLADAIASIGKRLTAFTPFQMGPADSLYMFGYDYRKSCQAGLHSIALEIMEEVTSRRFQIVQGWESVGIANATTAMAAAGVTEILWTMATCNSPEHWNTFRDQPCILEREALALPTLRTVMPDGRRLRTLDGFLTIFGTDLLQEDWRWLTLRTDEGWGYPVLRQHGLTIVWSQSALYHHMHRNGMWPVSSAVCTLRYAGIPVSQAADVSALRHLQPGEWMLLVSPDGLEAQEVRCIEEAVGRGVHLCVMGEVHHPRLLALLGIAEAQDRRASERWQVRTELADLPASSGLCAGLGGYRAESAEALVETEDHGAVLTVRRTDKARIVFWRRLRQTLPPCDLPKTEAEANVVPIVVETLGASGFRTVRQQMQSVVTMLPDELDIACARALQKQMPDIPAAMRGQLVAFRSGPDEDMLLVENSCNLMYLMSHVRLPRRKQEQRQFPHIRPNGPGGYIFNNDPSAVSFDAVVPPDASIPVRIRYLPEKEGNA